MHAGAQLFEHLFRRVALVVGANARLLVAVKPCAARHRAAAKHRQSALLGEFKRRQHVGVFLLDEFAHRLPDADAFRPVVCRLVVGRAEVVADGRARHGVGRLAGGAPEDFQRRLLGFIEELACCSRPADDDDLVEAGDDRGRAERNDGLGKARQRHLRAFDMQMPVDHARREIFARGVDDLGLRADIVGDVADGDDAFAINGDVGLIDFLRDDIDEATAPDRQRCLAAGA
ncbi:hypothetical protein D9M72_506980 [compost metagenome]